MYTPRSRIALPALSYKLTMSVRVARARIGQGLPVFLATNKTNQNAIHEEAAKLTRSNLGAVSVEPFADGSQASCFSC